MPRKKPSNRVVNKKAVYEAAREIAKGSEMPTIKMIRDRLDGHGSETTLHKYLSLWKKDLLNLAAKVNEIGALELSTDGTFSEDKLTLEKELSEQAFQNKILAAELIKCEKENSRFQDKIETTQKNVEEITELYQALLIKAEHLEKLYQEIKIEREVMVEAILRDKNAQIESLQKELKEMNQANLDYIKKIGFEGDDALIREKVRAISFEDKVNLLTKEVKDLQSELKKEKELNQPLMQKINKQKDFIQKMITWEQMQEYEKLMSEG